MITTPAVIGLAKRGLKKHTIPTNIKACKLISLKKDKLEENPAPKAIEGATFPPDAPIIKVKIVAINRAKKSSGLRIVS